MAGQSSVARGITQARGVHEIVDVEVKLAKLPKALDGFTIVQLSDLHVGLTIDREFVQRVVDLTNGLSPDLDRADRRPRRRPGRAICATTSHRSRSSAPSTACSRSPATTSTTPAPTRGSRDISSLGARYLRNELVTIGDGDALRPRRRRRLRRRRLAPAMARTSRAATANARSEPRARPARASTAASAARREARRRPAALRSHARRPDLAVALHRQAPARRPARRPLRARGTQLYVTRGCGYWGPPVRLLAPLEITRVILRSA